VNPVTSPPRPRNATERSILDAARELIAESGYEGTTIDGIARRAIVSRTAVYFYFPNKRAIVDRLIQRSFADMYAAASPYLDGSGDPRQELRDGIAGVAKVVNRDAPVMLLAARHAGERSHMPDEWMPHLMRLVVAAEKRIERDQGRGLAFDDVPAQMSAQALCSMVERHITLEVIRGEGVASSSIWLLAELWYRAVYSRPAADAGSSGAPSA
jgi:TetR/AcrR family transcriptional regulator, ethionamide resistance regulator